METKTLKQILMAKVHIAKKDLGLGDDEYKSIINRIANKDSSAKCTEKQLDKIVKEFERLGWKNRNNLKRKTRNAPTALIRKIYALWGELQSIDEVKSRDKTALDKFVAKRTKISSVQFIDNAQAMQIIEALKKWIARCHDR